MRSIFIIAGENSGENYGAALVHQFKKIHPSIEFFGIGGENMAKEGIDLIFSLNELALVGAIEVISHLPRIKKNFNRIKKEIKRKKPVAAVLIDSPDFNLRLAKVLKKHSIPVLYYISPTVWAWRKRRLKTIKKTIDKMMLIFPFEQDIYREYDIPAVYIGHPLKERVRISLSKEDFFHNHGFDIQSQLIAILPGSRKSEIKYHMPVLIKALEKIKKSYNAQFVFLLAENLDKSFLTNFIPEDFNEIKILSEDKYDAMAFSNLVLSSHGTANLEAALLETPLISFYRLSPISYRFGINFIKIKNFSIVNILAGEKVIPELVQKNFTPENIFQESKRLLDSEELRSEMIHHFKRIKVILGEKIASQNAAKELEKIVIKKS